MKASITCRKALRVLLPLAFWLGVWQLLSMKVGQELLLPSPASAAVTLWDLLFQQEFWLTALWTLTRIFGGMAAGVALGVALAALTCLSRVAELLLAPLVKVILATPVASFIVLVLLWVRTGLVPAVISMLIVLPVVWGNIVRGVREMDSQLLEMAAAYRFGRGKTLRLIVVPSVLPYFSSACMTAIGLSWKAGVAAEVLCRPEMAIGTQVYFSKINLETPSLFAWTAVIILLSLLLEKGLAILLGKGLGKAQKGAGV